MKKEDDRILEFLDREGWACPEHIAEETSIDISEGHVDDRLMLLWYAGLVGEVWDDAYEISMDGMRYLEGELDVEHLPRPTPERVRGK